VLRQADRASQSRMIYARIDRVLKRWQRGGPTLPQSALGKAISCALGQWESLEVYLKDGTTEIDNNLVENAIRPTHLEKTMNSPGLCKVRQARVVIFVAGHLVGWKVQ
jgi:Transposase IS66 family